MKSRIRPISELYSHLKFCHLVKVFLRAKDLSSFPLRRIQIQQWWRITYTIDFCVVGSSQARPYFVKVSIKLENRALWATTRHPKARSIKHIAYFSPSSARASGQTVSHLSCHLCIHQPSLISYFALQVTRFKHLEIELASPLRPRPHPSTHHVLPPVFTRVHLPGI